MKNILILVSAILMLFACDRFEHNFKPEYKAPIAKISANVVQGYAPLEVTFTDSSKAGTKEIISWKWDFDNNGQIDSTEENPLHTFSDIGDFLVKLTISDGETASSDSLIIYVFEVGSPVADFNFDIVTAHAPVEVNFSDLSTPGTFDIITWQWDFDNDSIVESEEQNPTYKFTFAGTYNIKLTVSDGNLESSVIKTIIVQENSVFIELFTATWCSNCPIAESALYNLNQEFIDQLTYVEYHIGGDIDYDNSELLGYYTYPNVGIPLTVVNGNEHIYTTASADLINRIRHSIQNVLNESFDAKITLNEMTIDDNQLNVKVSLNLEQTVSLSNLKLKYILMEEMNDEYHNSDGEELHNVVWFKDMLNLTSYNNSDILEFNISNLEQYPNDIFLVIWVQTIEPIYNANTCRVYNVIKKSILCQ